ncbi:MAG: SMC-Scp complex subunit ScpB [Planctomycetes bacterium]|nr:SMC-Scp complex subunit ScpB [Planctomycetota bacterium]
MARKKSSKSNSISIDGGDESLPRVDDAAAGDAYTAGGGHTEGNDGMQQMAPEAGEVDSLTNAGSESGDANAATNNETPDAASAAEPETPMPVLPADISDDALARIASALIFASTKPISASKLSELLVQSPGRIRSALAGLDEKLRIAGVPFKLAEIAGGFRYMTDESVAKYVSALRGEQKKERLSGAALETLAIIAYRQPVTKGEIEAMRGVQAGPMLRMLLEKRLVRITGRAPVPGRPLQYGTTREFLDKFNLATLKDLPTVEELAKP